MDVSTQTYLYPAVTEDMHCNFKPFTEKSFMDSGKEYVRLYTGLPIVEVLKTVFDFVVPPTTHKTKLTQFQEFALTHKIETRSSF